jgi:hypothetical protein
MPKFSNMRPLVKEFIYAGVYDPSFLRPETGSYWQWHSSKPNFEWTRVAESINQGWPTQSGFEDLSSRCYGCILSGDKSCWIYRIYGAGRDRFGREGRYFFVLVRVASHETALSPHVAGLFHYFESERSLPLKTDTLDNGWSGEAPDRVLKALMAETRRAGEGCHWGMDESLRLTTFNTVSSSKPAQPTTTKGQPETNYYKKSPLGPITKWKKVVCCVAAIVLIGWIIYALIPPEPDEPNYPVPENAGADDQSESVHVIDNVSDADDKPSSGASSAGRNAEPADP